MLQTPDENGARLAAVMPTALSMLTATGDTGADVPTCMIVIVADGLGARNLEGYRAYARTLSKLDALKASTVFPTTTGAALTTITTGVLPGQHGLVGYRIMHPELGLRTTLSEWQGITEVRQWQMRETVFERAHKQGVNAYALGRPQHATGGLTEAMLTGAKFIGEAVLEDRFERAIELAYSEGPTLIYLYVDELDRAGHEHGAESDTWLAQLERLDGAVETLLRRVPERVGMMLTADHGMVDVSKEGHVVIGGDDPLLNGVAAVGGEPRLRYWYLESPEQSDEIAARARAFFGERARVMTRGEAIAAGWFGRVAPEAVERIGHVIVAAATGTAIYSDTDSPASREMIGQHGSLTAVEREVPILCAGHCDAQDVATMLDAYAGSLGRGRKPRKR